MESVDCESIKESECCCSFLNSLPKSIRNIISWKSPIKTGALLALWIVLVFMVKSLSFISVFAYCGLFFILSSMAFRVYSNFANKDAVHPLNDFLDKDISVYLSRVSGVVRSQTEEENSVLNKTINYLRDIFLLQNYSDVVKFLLTMLTMVYVGMWVDMLDLATIVAVALLTLPKIYSIYKTEIDTFAAKVKEQTMVHVQQIKEKLSMLPMIGNKVKQL